MIYSLSSVAKCVTPISIQVVFTISTEPRVYLNDMCLNCRTRPTIISVIKTRKPKTRHKHCQTAWTHR